MKQFAYLLLVLLMCSCNPMKKNAMKDRADDIKEAVITENGDGIFLVLKEEVFQAVSKSDQGGFRRISGYTEDRISSYDINTGALVKRIVLGEREENECTFLGETNGMLWYKSVNKEIGVHAKDPKTLGVSVTQESIVNANPFLANNLSMPEWNNIKKYYGFDVMKMMPMVSDNAGYVYYIDPVSLKAEKTQESVKDFEFDNTCISTSMNIDANTSISLRGNPRNSLYFRNKELKEPSFLDGNFLKSSNIIYGTGINSGFLAPLREKIESYSRQIDSLNNALEGTGSNSADRQSGTSLRNTSIYMKRNIENLTDRRKQAEDEIERYSDDRLFDIITDDGGVFVMSRTDVSDTARVVISKVSLGEDTTAALAWQTKLSNVYSEPDKGFDKSAFEFVFSKGDPDLNTMRALYYRSRLIFIFMLTATCIDTDTGKILWTIDL